jgi:hypothetical protein
MPNDPLLLVADVHQQYIGVGSQGFARVTTLGLELLGSIRTKFSEFLARETNKPGTDTIRKIPVIIKCLSP